MKVETLYLSHGVVTISFHCHKLTSEDESYVDIHDFNVPTLFELGDISSSAFHVTCIYNSFCNVYMVSLVDIAAGDVVNIDFMYPHGPRKTFN